MAVTVYRWDDPSGPGAITGAANSVHTVLKACLVDGYAGKTAAGWSFVTGTAAINAYRQGTGTTQMYFRVDSTSSQFPRVRGYETITDVTAGTGTGLFPTEVQLAGGGYWVTSTTADATGRPWMLVANARSFYLYIGHDVTTASGLLSSTYKMGYFFGDIFSFKSGDAYSQTIICNTTGAVATNAIGALTNLNTVIAGHWIVRSYTQTGSAVTAGKMHDAQRSNGAASLGVGGATYPDPVSGGMILSPILVTEGGLVTRGYLPGLWSPMHNLPAAAGDDFTGSGSLAGKSFIQLDTANLAVRARIVVETSDTWS